jgi:hypothetical protein
VEELPELDLTGDPPTTRPDIFSRTLDEVDRRLDASPDWPRLFPPEADDDRNRPAIQAVADIRVRRRRQDIT